MQLALGIDLRLVVQRQRAGADGLLEPLVQQIFLDYSFAHRCGINDNAPPPALFGVVHGNVGVTQQGGRVSGVIGQTGHTDTAGQADISAVELKGLLQHL